MINFSAPEDRGEIFSLKFTKYRSPRLPSRNKGCLLLRGGKGKGGGKEGRGRGRRGEELAPRC